MRVAILQPGYLPWLGFFEQMYRSDLFVLYDDVQYDKKSWRNRNRIRTKEGWIWLTVPVFTKGNFDQKICEVKIDNKLPWREKHWKALAHNYQKSPFFGKYSGFLQDAYAKDWEYLADLDEALIRHLAEQLGIKTKIIRSSDLHIDGGRIEKIIGTCKAVGADALYDGEASENFIDKQQFRNEGVEVEFQHYDHPEYRQVYQPFISYMSVVDLLFNCGKNSLGILSNEVAAK